MNISKIFKINLLKTIYFTFRYRRLILIGTNTSVNLSRNAKIIINETGRLELGVQFSYKQKTVLDIYSGGELIISGKVSINAGSKILIGENAVLVIGDGTYINEHSRVQCRDEIRIGKDCAIAWGVNILDTDEHIICYPGQNESKSPYAPVNIGDHVWIGCNSIILKGSTIKDNCVVGAGSIVTHSFGPNNLIIGNPARSIKSDVTWKNIIG